MQGWNFTKGLFCGAAYAYISEESVLPVLYFLGKAAAELVGFNGLIALQVREM